MESFEEKIVYVDKYAVSDWSPELLFRGYDVRLIMKKVETIGENFENVTKAHQLAKKYLGKENKDWVMEAGFMQIETNAFYLKDMGYLIALKIVEGNNDILSDSGLFDRIEIHDTTKL